ncbi:MAG: hypothetical protein ACLP0J_28255 [Solirubrobacteraceae bacterium]
MTQIYNVIQSTSDRYVLDPDRGMVQRRELVMQASDVHAIKHGDEQFEVAPDGTFDVPAHVAAHFLRQPGWHEGSNPFAEVEPEPGKPARAKTKAPA